MEVLEPILHRLRKRSFPLTADEEHALIGVSSPALRRAPPQGPQFTASFNNGIEFGSKIRCSSSHQLGRIWRVKNSSSCATFMRPGVLNRLASTNSVSPGPQAAKRSWTRAWCTSPETSRSSAENVSLSASFHGLCVTLALPVSIFEPGLQ